MHGRRGSRNTLFAGSHVRGDDQRFGELNTCAGYTAPGNNRVVYQTLSVISDIWWYTAPGNNRVVYREVCCRLRDEWYTPPRNNRVVYHKMPHVEFEERYTPPRNNGVVYRWTLCYHCRDGEDNVQSLHTFSAAVSYSATSHRAFSTCL